MCCDLLYPIQYSIISLEVSGKVWVRHVVGISFVMRHSKNLPGFPQHLATTHLQTSLPAGRHLLRRHGQVSVKVFDYLAKQVAIVIPLTAPSMRRTRCKRKVEVLALFNQFLS